MRLAPDLAAEARRQLTVCNACRYCEGYCATFLALEKRPSLADGDIALIANICHDCRGCEQACMYTPPHEFAIRIPRLLSDVRAETYRHYAWPRRAATLFRRSASSAVGGSIVGAVFMAAVVVLQGDVARLVRADPGPGSFYRVIPFDVMAWTAGLATLAALAIWIGTAIAFARDAKVRLLAVLDPREVLGVAKDALTLRWMKGGGDGCYYPHPEKTSDARRLLHALLVLGFIAANISTALAAGYEHLLGMEPPFPVTSPPVLFGIAGGIGMVVGTTGLLAMKARSVRRLLSGEMLQMDVAFLVVFDLVSITGFLTLIFRETPLMSAMLIAHLATLCGLFVLVPYGKFAHVLYRLVALFQNRRELAQDAADAPRMA